MSKIGPKKCKDCGFSPAYHPEKCPKCGGEMEEKKSYGAVIFKGPGFYSTDK